MWTGTRLPFFDRLRGRDQVRQLVRAVVSAFRRRGLQPGAEAQVARAILRAIQQVVDFLQVAGAALQLVLDHAPSPGVGAGVAHRAGNALQLGEFVDRIAERQPERIKLDRVLALQVAVTIAKAADERSVGQLLDLEQRCRHGVERAGQLNVDVGLALRSHIRSSTSAICERAPAGAKPLASCRGCRRRDERRRPAFCRDRAPTER